jgi:hypothetical protein
MPPNAASAFFFLYSTNVVCARRGMLFMHGSMLIEANRWRLAKIFPVAIASECKTCSGKQSDQAACPIDDRNWHLIVHLPPLGVSRPFIHSWRILYIPIVDVARSTKTPDAAPFAIEWR